MYAPDDGNVFSSEVSENTLTVPSSPPSIYIDVPYLYRTCGCTKSGACPAPTLISYLNLKNGSPIDGTFSLFSMTNVCTTTQRASPFSIGTYAYILRPIAPYQPNSILYMVISSVFNRYPLGPLPFKLSPLNFSLPSLISWN